MSKKSHPLLLMHHDAGVQARVRLAAGRGFSVRTVPSWERLSDALRAAPLTSVALVDPHQGAGAELAPEMRVLMRSFPCAVVLATVHGRNSSAADLRTLGEWGVADVIAEDEDGVPEIERMLHSARERPLRGLIEAGLPEELGAEARRMLSAAAETALTGGGAPDLARAVHVSMRTLVRRCERAGLPAPRQLLGWMRILLAAELLEDPTRPVDSIARACGYASDGGLRRALRDLLGSSPKALRKAGPFAVASRAFLGVLGAGRSRAVRPATPSACLREGRPRPGTRRPPAVHG
jgi:AraC-like DNA-binding protein